MTPSISSERLTVRPLQTCDIEDAFKIFSDPRVFEHFGKGVRTYQQVRESTDRIVQKWKTQNRGDFAVIYKDQMIGQMLLLENDDDEFELGYVFHPAFWGQGFASEACCAGLAYVFDSRHAPFVVACVRERNEREL